MIYIAVPCYGGLTSQTSEALLLAGQSRFDVHIQQQDYSALCFNFNTMWADMLNKRRNGADISHFVMVHSDIKVIHDRIDGNWLDVLVNECEHSKVDVLSIVAPLKDERGLTSTGVYDVQRGVIVKRLTMAEVSKLPTTFGIYDLWNKLDISVSDVDGKEKNVLAVNTGLMCVKVPVGNDDCWCEKVFFHMKDYMLKITDKEMNKVEFVAQFISEDWLFSVDVQSLGCNIVASTKVPIEHMGRYGYANYGVWGLLEEDDLSR